MGEEASRDIVTTRTFSQISRPFTFVEPKYSEKISFTNKHYFERKLQFRQVKQCFHKKKKKPHKKPNQPKTEDESEILKKCRSKIEHFWLQQSQTKNPPVQTDWKYYFLQYKILDFKQTEKAFCDIIECITWRITSVELLMAT